MNLNFSTLVWKIKEWEIKKKFCRSLPYFSIYPGPRLINFKTENKQDEREQSEIWIEFLGVEICEPKVIELFYEEN